MSDRALSLNPIFSPTQVLGQLQSGQMFYVLASPGNALILCHPHHAEIVGPDAAVGGTLDLDCARIVPVGKVALTYPESFVKRRAAFVIRHKWISATQKAVDCPVPLKRARAITIMIAKYCGWMAVRNLEDEVLAQIVGVLPSTIATARRAVLQELRAKAKQQRRAPVATPC
ncbi:MAG: hypothetical protein HC910_11630 [Spirulinaceae cyanobacterium SM2_1_0]|nr:hypothetical protein [Spirulinaceae cyanobacterium SM2_1_0]